MSEDVGFIGLGTMGEPMALNLRRGGVPLVVWNRSLHKTESLRAAGAELASGADEIFARCKIILTMLSGDLALDEVICRESSEFGRRIQGRLIVNMGTASAEYSMSLEKDIILSGGKYVEAPISGSRKPAEDAQLIAMLAGDPNSIETVYPFFSLMCRKIFICGAAPSALRMKFAVNLFLIGMVTSLAEAFHFAERQKLDLTTFLDVLLEGPMASDVVRIKGPKLVSRDFSTQASIRNVLRTNRLIVEAARQVEAASPIADQCLELYSKALQIGRGEADVIGVIDAIEKAISE